MADSDIEEGILPSGAWREFIHTVEPKAHYIGVDILCVIQMCVPVIDEDADVFLFVKCNEIAVMQVLTWMKSLRGFPGWIFHHSCPWWGAIARM